MIREGKTHMIVNMIQSGIKDGMHTLNTSLIKLVQSNICSLEDALLKSSHPDELRNIAGKNYVL
jgi:twitching motility protein PilT